ncbi:MAG: FAD-dependent thymidylate synthase [Methanomassiliicoccales archaeon]|jgi:thymidylate synthase (FAD)
MKVVLLSYTKDAEMLCAAAGHSCYSKKPASELLKSLPDEKISSVIDSVMESGHHSVIEHASFTFSVEGVSRSMTHQLVRHRLASFSQQSQRFVSLKEPSYVVPESIKGDADLEKEFKELMESSWRTYRKLAERVPVEDARYVLPNACTTNIVVTMNARELWHLFTLRCCNRAQEEIRKVADEMLRQAKEATPALFKKAGPPCVRGPCPEGKLTCGKPRKRELSNP